MIKNIYVKIFSILYAYSIFLLILTLILELSNTSPHYTYQTEKFPPSPPSQKLFYCQLPTPFKFAMHFTRQTKLYLELTRISKILTTKPFIPPFTCNSYPIENYTPTWSQINPAIYREFCQKWRTLVPTIVCTTFISSNQEQENSGMKSQLTRSRHYWPSTPSQMVHNSPAGELLTKS